MSWHWYAIMGVVRLLFLFAPFKDISKDFAISEVMLPETKEFANASNCIAILISFPVLMLFTVLAAAHTADPSLGINSMVFGFYILIALVVGLLLFLTPVEIFRGTIPPFLCLGAIISIEVLINIFVLDYLVDWLRP